MVNILSSVCVVNDGCSHLQPPWWWPWVVGTTGADIHGDRAVMSAVTRKHKLTQTPGNTRMHAGIRSPARTHAHTITTQTHALKQHTHTLQIPTATPLQLKAAGSFHSKKEALVRPPWSDRDRQTWGNGVSSCCFVVVYVISCTAWMEGFSTVTQHIAAWRRIKHTVTEILY